MKPLKKFKTFEEQIAILEDRGIIINDKNYALKILSWVNYYRLSGYLLPFQKIDPTTNSKIEITDKSGEKYFQLIDNLNFETIVKVYNFDNELRLFLLSLLVEIETYLKTQIAYFCGKKFGPSWYHDQENFFYKDPRQKNDFYKKIKKEIENRNIYPLVIEHHKKKYKSMPIWVVVDFFTFSDLCDFLKNWKDDVLDNFANITAKTLKSQKNLDSEILLNWIDNCKYLRNWCAHLNRLYFFKFDSDKQRILEVNLSEKEEYYVYKFFLILKEIFPDKRLWNNKINNELSGLFEKYKKEIQLNHIGFPESWRTELMNTN